MKKIFNVLVVAFIIGSMSCSQDDDDNQNPNNPNNPGSGITISSNPLFSGTLDGTTVSYQTNVFPMNGGSGSGFVWSFGASLLDGNDAPQASLEIGKLEYPTPIDQEVYIGLFDQFLSQGSRQYSNDVSNGVKFSVWVNGTEWSTVGNQTGSTFSFDAVSSLNSGGEHFVKFKATLNCKVYNGNQSKTLSGVYVNYFQFMY